MTDLIEAARAAIAEDREYADDFDAGMFEPSWSTTTKWPVEMHGAIVIDRKRADLMEQLVTELEAARAVCDIIDDEGEDWPHAYDAILLAMRKWRDTNPEAMEKWLNRYPWNRLPEEGLSE